MYQLEVDRSRTLTFWHRAIDWPVPDFPEPGRLLPITPCCCCCCCCSGTLGPATWPLRPDEVRMKVKGIHVLSNTITWLLLIHIMFCLHNTDDSSTVLRNSNTNTVPLTSINHMSIVEVQTTTYVKAIRSNVFHLLTPHILWCIFPPEFHSTLLTGMYRAFRWGHTSCLT